MLCITNNSFKYQLLVYTQLNDQTVQFQIIQLSISLLFTLSLNVTHFYLTHRLDQNRCYHCWPVWTWERSQSLSPKFQYYWNLTIRLFSVISRTLVRQVLPLCRDAVGVFCSPSWLGRCEIGIVDVRETKILVTNLLINFAF